MSDIDRLYHKIKDRYSIRRTQVDATVKELEFLVQLLDMMEDDEFCKDKDVPCSGWISCKDRLPEENKAVNIVWVNRNPPSYYKDIKNKPFVATGVYYDGDWYWWSDVIEDVIAEYGGRVVIPGNVDPDIEITHWQSLPEPPKEGDKE